MSAPLVLTERHEGVTVVTLNRPEALNALSSALRSALVRRSAGWPGIGPRK